MSNIKLNYEILLFDLDGTLADTKEGILNSMKYAGEKMGKKFPDHIDLSNFIGPPIEIIYHKHLGYKESELSTAISYHKERYSAIGYTETALFDGVPQMLEDLKNKGKALAVATSKTEEFAHKILEAFNIHHYFDSINGSGSDNPEGNKAVSIRNALKNVTPSDYSKVLMIGDRLHDIEGAKEVGIHSMGILYGYGSEEELTKHGANYIAATPNEISQLF